MVRASTKSSVKKDPPAEKTIPAPPTDSAPPRENPGRDLLELRLRWKIINETVEAGIAERKRLREAIDALTKEMQQNRAEG
jgi:hypothetical protein